LKLGFPFDSADWHQLQAAKSEAIRQKQLLRAYLNAEVRDQLVAGDVLAAQLWSTTTAQAIQTGGNVGFVYPREGFPLYCDCACVLRESGRYELAHAFLDYLLQPSIAASNARVANTASTNAAAVRLVPSDPVLYPPVSIYNLGVWPYALSAKVQKYRDILWTEIRSY